MVAALPYELRSDLSTL